MRERNLISAEIREKYKFLPFEIFQKNELAFQKELTGLDKFYKNYFLSYFFAKIFYSISSTCGKISDFLRFTR